MVELADTPDLGSGGVKPVGVRVPPSAPKNNQTIRDLTPESLTRDSLWELFYFFIRFNDKKQRESEEFVAAFLNDDQVRTIRAKYGTPVYVYDQRTLEAQAEAVLNFPNAFGLTARYAMKALPNSTAIRILTQKGLHIDASSGYEAERAMRAGVPGPHILLTAQQLPKNLKYLIEQGVIFNACSLNQLRIYGDLFPGRSLSVRINPGLGSGHSKRTNVGGPASSFGIWHEYISDIYKNLQTARFDNNGHAHAYWIGQRSRSMGTRRIDVIENLHWL